MKFRHAGDGGSPEHVREASAGAYFTLDEGEELLQIALEGMMNAERIVAKSRSAFIIDHSLLAHDQHQAAGDAHTGRDRKILLQIGPEKPHDAAEKEARQRHAEKDGADHRARNYAAVELPGNGIRADADQRGQ
jgi:hypothetical protein